MTANLVCPEGVDITFTIIYATFGAAVFVANVFTCVVFLSHRRLRETYMNIFLVSLAFSDILMAILLVPGHAIFCTGCSESFGELASPLICRNLDGLKDYVLVNSMFNVLAITYDRYVAVICPLYYRQRMTRLSVSLLLLSIWITPLPVAFIKPILQDLNISVLVGDRAEKIFDIIVVSSCVILPIFILVVVNARIANAIRKQVTRVAGTTSVQEREQRKRERSGTLSCLLIMITSTVCWLPRTLLNFFNFFESSCINMNLLAKVSLVFLLVQSLVNPLVYSFYRKDFRDAASDIRRQLGLIHWRQNHNMVQQFPLSKANSITTF